MSTKVSLLLFKTSMILCLHILINGKIIAELVAVIEICFAIVEGACKISGLHFSTNKVNHRQVVQASG